jgi:drug/metabolite transporter (DMT)-like permease
MSKGHVVDVVTSPQVSAPAYFGAFLVGLFGDFAIIDTWIKLAALIGAILLLAAHVLTIRNKWLEGRKLKLEIENAKGES